MQRSTVRSLTYLRGEPQLVSCLQNGVKRLKCGQHALAVGSGRQADSPGLNMRPKWYPCTTEYLDAQISEVEDLGNLCCRQKCERLVLQACP
jgi:hypothetical protein